MVGWKVGNTRYLGVYDADGAKKQGMYNVSVVDVDGVPTTVSWGKRDDTWRTLCVGSVVWLEAPVDSGNVLRIFRMKFGDGPDPDPVPDPNSGCGVNPIRALLIAVIMCFVLALF